MFSVTIKGRTLDELKKSTGEIYQQLDGGATLVNGLEKDMSEHANVKGGSGNNKVEEVAAPMESRSTVISEPVANVVAASNELDAENLPWDKRIHASSKGKVKDGTWRLKRGIDPTLVEQVKQELRQAQHNAANPPVVPALNIVPETPVVTPQVEAPAPVVETPVVTAPVATTLPATPPQPNMNGGHTVDTFKNQFTMILGQLISDGTVTQEYVEQLKAHFGVAEIWNLSDTQKEELYSGFVSFGYIKAA